MCGEWAHVLDDADTATARLMIHLQLDDLVSLAACDRANRSGDVPSDGEVARQLYAEELRECLARLEPEGPDQNATAPQSMAEELMQIQERALRDSQACMKRHEEKSKREAAASNANGLAASAPSSAIADSKESKDSDRGKRKRSGDNTLGPCKRLQINSAAQVGRRDAHHDRSHPPASVKGVRSLPATQVSAAPQVTSLDPFGTESLVSLDDLRDTAKPTPRVKLPPTHPVAKQPNVQRATPSESLFGVSSFGVPKKVQCKSCLQTIMPFCARHTLSCKHTYCIRCIEALLNKVIADARLFPPRCCGQNIDPEKVRILQGSSIMAAYNEKYGELADTNKIFCHVPDCSTYISKQHRSMGMELGSVRGATCPQCKSVTCVDCKGPKHALLGCPPGTNMER